VEDASEKLVRLALPDKLARRIYNSGSSVNFNSSGKDSDMDEQLLQRAYDLGYEFERKYHGCTQCVIGAVYQVFPAMRSEDIFRAANAQAGGMGLTSMGQCGAAVGAGMIISQLYGRSLGDIADPEKKRFVAYRMGQEFANRFSKEMGSLICGEIQERMMGRRFNLLDPLDWEAFEKAGGHDRHCPVVVGTATRIVVEMLLGGREDPGNP
jgi:C_GCAxxG_C_C family probable redox protein